MPQQRQQRERQKGNRLKLIPRQSNNSARASRFFVLFLAITAGPGQEHAKFQDLCRT